MVERGCRRVRLVLSTIAGSLITVTGVVFSVTIVALQLASTQFAPRILRNFLADRSNQIVLGVLISTFTYTLLVLRMVRSKAEGSDAFVPHISVTVAILLSLVSVGFLIHFIHHAARSIQASVILERVTDDALYNVERLFPNEIGKPTVEDERKVEIPSTEPEAIRSCSSGYLQAVDGKSLFDLGKQNRMLIRMTVPIGAFILEGQTLAEVWAEAGCSEDSRAEIRKAFVTGEQRTPDQDAEFNILEIADMGVKALSPGINDPTTANHCIDRLTQILLTIGKRSAPDPMRTEEGRVHFLAMTSTFNRAFGVAFDQIYHYGRDNPMIVGRLRKAVAALEQLLPREQHPVLRTFAVKLNGHTASD